MFVWSYFFWDALDAMINFDDLGFLIHGEFLRNAYFRTNPPALTLCVAHLGLFCFTLYMMTFVSTSAIKINAP